MANDLKKMLIDMDDEDELMSRSLDDVADRAVKRAVKLKGDQGPKGDRGEQGPKGERGPVGPQGIKGDIGPRGYTGTEGPKGDKGEKGNNGDSVELKDVLAQVMPSVMSRLPTGGGSMNRQMLIGGVDPLTRYTDVNYIAGSNVTITYQNNDTAKRVDITFSATGGGGGGGIVRSINSVATNTNAGSATGTDYVYLAAGTITITLPTTVGNSNLYTIKNIGAGTVTIATTGGDLIDGSVNLQMPVQFTSVDLISNNSGNWDIT